MSRMESIKPALTAQLGYFMENHKGEEKSFLFWTGRAQSLPKAH